MLWSEFLAGLDKLRSEIRANRLLEGRITAEDPFLNLFRSLIILQPLPEEKPEEPKETKESIAISEDARMLQVGEVKGYVEPRITKLIVRSPVLEDGEDALAEEEGND